MKINFNRDKFEQLEQYFRDACNVNLFFHDLSREVSYEPKVRNAICTELRSIPQLHAKCHQCTLDAQERCLETKKLQIYQCHAGFTEVMLPVFINNICAGFLIFGQIINTDNPVIKQRIQQSLDEYMRLHHFNIENMEPKLTSSVEMTTQRISSVASLMTICASHLLLSEIVKLESVTTPILLENYINKNLHEPLHSDDICQALNISRSQLYLVAKDHFKCGISQYIQTKRIERAKELLTTTTDEISFVAEQIGILDNAYFSRLFKKCTGLSPNQYRKTYGTMQKTSPHPNSKRLPEGS